MTLSERNVQLLTQWLAGIPARDIASRFGIGTCRVRQLAYKYGVPRLRRVDAAYVTCNVCRGRYPPGQHREHRASAGHFWRQVDRSGDCWTINRQRHARRAWELSTGPIPPGLFVCHRCDNPPCVRPDHLFLGTSADNAHDRDHKGRDRFSRGLGPPQLERCKSGHPFETDAVVWGGRRVCGACGRDRAARYRARKRTQAA